MEKESKRRKNKVSTKLKGVLLRLIVAIIIVIIACALVKFMKKDKLIGQWTTDGVTAYEFDGKGKGALITSVTRYDFSYKIKKNKVYIDFDAEKIVDSAFEFSIEEGKLNIKGIDGTTGSYILTKK